MTALTTEVLDGIARLVLDLEGESVNKISREVRDELGEALDRIERDGDIQAAVLISGKPGSFIAGADIDEFVALRSRDEARTLVRTGQTLVNRMGSTGKPIVAAIHGTCVGGGFEATLACTYRIATDDSATKIGLPEVQLGIIPAAGGCQRLPRLIGAQAALDIILAGKTVPAASAYRRGMVDDLVHPAILERVALEAARRLAGGWRPQRRKRGGVRRVALEGNPLGRRLLFRIARKQVLERTGGNYPAPLAALEAVQHGLSYGIEAGLDMEAAHFADLAVGDVSRELVGIFFATTAMKRDAGVPDPPEPKPIGQLAIAGAGFMGSGIGGTAVLRAGVDVRFKDANLDAVGKGLAAARKMLDKRKKRRRITRYEHRRKISLISGGVDWSGFQRADLVVEAVPEDLEIKRAVFRDLEQHTRADCVLASNTSTIPIEQIAAATGHPERVLGMHFFSPVEKMPLLEVIVTETTAPWAIVTAVSFGREMGKTVIVVRDCAGFWVNRILAPYLNEAGRLVTEGVRIDVLDARMTKFGFPVGPVNLMDEVGLDVGQKAVQVLHEAFGDRMKPAAGIDALVRDKRLGRKTGRGFYLYEGGKKRGVDESVYAIVGAASDSTVHEDDIDRRLMYVMLNEAARALDEGVVRSARDGDIAAIFGFGFPPFRGGPMRYMDRIGIRQTVETLQELEHLYGDRFTPAPALVRMADAGDRFYSDN